MFAIMIAIAGAFGSFTSVWMELARNSILMWYAFHTVSRVSDGKMKFQMPEFHDIDSIIRPVVLGIAVTVASFWPLIVVVVGGLAGSAALLGANEAPIAGPQSEPAAAYAQTVDTPPDDPAVDPDEVEFDWEEERRDEDGEADDDMTGVGFAIGVGMLLLALGYAYSVFYTPVALIVAALSQSALQTMNPVIGFRVIKQIGRAYGEVLVFYLIIRGVQFGFDYGLGRIPLVGPFLTGFVDAYAFLTIGCLLGLVVDKHAEELGLE